MMFFGFLLVIGLVVAVAYALGLFGPRTGDFGSMMRRETPMEILRKRYAQGEISKEEYERMRDDLAS
jgi:putative membrane protein